MPLSAQGRRPACGSARPAARAPAHLDPGTPLGVKRISRLEVPADRASEQVNNSLETGKLGTASSQVNGRDHSARSSWRSSTVGVCQRTTTGRAVIRARSSTGSRTQSLGRRDAERAGLRGPCQQPLDLGAAMPMMVGKTRRSITPAPASIRVVNSFSGRPIPAKARIRQPATSGALAASRNSASMHGSSAGRRASRPTRSAPIRMIAEARPMPSPIGSRSGPAGSRRRFPSHERRQPPERRDPGRVAGSGSRHP